MTTGEDGGRLARLEQQVQEMSARVAALERAGAARPPAAAARPRTEPAGGTGAGHDGPLITYSGEGRFGPHELSIRGRAGLGAVLGADPDLLAQVFTAMASPVRLILLRAMLGEPRNSQQLRELLDAGSAGQLYHHLRELMAAGLVSQPARSVYAIPREKVVAICVALTAALHLMPGALRVTLPPGVPEDGREGCDSPRSG